MGKEWRPGNANFVVTRVDMAAEALLFVDFILGVEVKTKKFRTVRSVRVGKIGPI